MKTDDKQLRKLLDEWAKYHWHLNWKEYVENRMKFKRDAAWMLNEMKILASFMFKAGQKEGIPMGGHLALVKLNDEIAIKTVKEARIEERRRTAEAPDVLMDFRQMSFPDRYFKLVVWDPPQVFFSPTSDMGKSYGSLNKKTWREDIKKGFDECWRVLDNYGVLILKWNESSVSKADLLKVISQQPLFGHPVGSKVKTHWFCFMKIPEEK